MKSKKILSEKKQICIVDDDASVCRALSLLLNTFDFEAQAFISAAEFLGSTLKHKAKCLILDVHMAEMDGFALQQRLETEGFQIPIIFISANKNLVISQKDLRSCGGVGFLQKPFNDQALVDLINIAVEGKQCK